MNRTVYRTMEINYKTILLKFSFLLIVTLIIYFLSDILLPPPVAFLGLTDPSADILSISFTFILLLILSQLLTISYQEYKTYHLNKPTKFKTNHRLSLFDIFDNNSRKLIIQLILDSPGIHFNGLLRQTGLATGQLLWHIKVLEEYGLINKKKEKNFLLLFPNHYNNNFDNPSVIIKSQLALKILEEIENCPGIYANAIAQKLHVKRNTTKYHIDKMITKGLIKVKKQGKKLLLFTNY